MSTYRVAFADTAEEGPLNIVDYIALDNPVRAKQLVEMLFVFHASRDVQALMAGLQGVIFNATEQHPSFRAPVYRTVS